MCILHLFAGFQFHAQFHLLQLDVLLVINLLNIASLLHKEVEAYGGSDANADAHKHDVPGLKKGAEQFS